MNRAHVHISGIVQGVWFRACAKKKADLVGANGWIRNLDDGRVEAVFEGKDYQVNEMISWCHHGSPLSEVEHVAVIYEKPKGDIGFEIIN